MTPASVVPLLPLEGSLSTIGSPALWGWTIAGVIALFVIDFLITRKPHEVSMKEAVGWSIFYVALPLLFGVFVVLRFGGGTGMEYYTGYLVEKSLSVDNLFVFMMLLAGFAVPRALQQRVLLIGVAGALVLRAGFIALGATLIESFAITFLFFGLILVATAVKVWRDAAVGHSDEDVSKLPVVRLVNKVWPVAPAYHGTRMTVVQSGGRALTPLAVVTLAILGTDLLFAIDSVPAVYGITGDPYLVFATNAFALLGLRALYFVLEGVLSKLVHLSYGLAIILAFIGVKLVLHWAHGVWDWVPTVPTLASLVVIVGVLALTTVTSLLASGRASALRPDEADAPVGLPSERVDASGS
ncbi:TerC/Alx family metal homeostasis membrane protein [Aestuariimicrobium sp. T2.26MG-19.2B]|uniref:TerC/Alx family metal homeostasis membrane protein n=1 Tax=Aestuariimicrobium sp. T2.26MG-19.2B TaxID=3040679 RepID=UPI0024777C4E|nr:TerC/Alx family metal homeostasis membrane protein [Aestuariimicrobium sp. T2.26MG-19.2B]CAI9408250.1 putative membrane protein [Aestuariimicrobium sp. T2.26MG-19.2B]